MSEQHRDEPFSESDLDSPEYRERLMRKLNCLIALLEVAMARVRRSMAGPDPDVERLTRIRSNLQSTLDVCLRARTALERREALPADLPTTLAQVARPDGVSEEAAREALRPSERKLPEGAKVELSTLEERLKFERLGRIGKEEVESCDVDELARRLQDQ